LIIATWLGTLAAMTRRWAHFSLWLLAGLIAATLMSPSIDAATTPLSTRDAPALTQPFSEAEICNCCIASLCPPGLAKVLAREPEIFSLPAAGHALPSRAHRHYADALITVPSPPPKA